MFNIRFDMTSVFDRLGSIATPCGKLKLHHYPMVLDFHALNGRSAAPPHPRVFRLMPHPLRGPILEGRPQAFGLLLWASATGTGATPFARIEKRTASRRPISHANGLLALFSLFSRFANQRSTLLPFVF